MKNESSMVTTNPRMRCNTTTLAGIYCPRLKSGLLKAIPLLLIPRLSPAKSWAQQAKLMTAISPLRLPLSRRATFALQSAPLSRRAPEELSCSSHTAIKLVDTRQYSAFHVGLCASSSTTEKTSSMNGLNVGIQTYCAFCQGLFYSCRLSRGHPHWGII